MRPKHIVPSLEHTCIDRWPEGAVVYQIYPRSFQDTNGDGIGDLKGVEQRLDYLEELGVSVLWLSPFYPSPMADFGYDVADYCDVDPLFGTLNDFKRLLAAIHQRGMRLIIDFVPNHTSDQHEWFKASSLSKDSDYADWYIWKDPHPDSSPDKPLPPNNWLDALTGGSAWEWSETRQQFYLHSFHKTQPDLNWKNRDVRARMHEVMRFWLDMGVDGFRVDAVYWLAKDPSFRDDPLSLQYIEGKDTLYDQLLHTNSSGWPTLYAYLAEMAEVLSEDAYKDRQPFMVTEAYPEQHNPIEAYMAFYEGVNPEVAAPFNFEGLSLPWSADSWRSFLQLFHTALAEHDQCCVPSYTFGNHDKPRLASRFSDDAARSAAVMQLTLPGMIFIYYGEEIGMVNGDISKDKIQDPGAKGHPDTIGRDPQRTPMQWTSLANAGFSDADPWLPVAASYKERNVQQELQDQKSFLSLYEHVITLRNTHDCLRRGSIEILDTEYPSLLIYTRTYEKAQCLMVINFSSEEITCKLPVSLQAELVSSVTVRPPDNRPVAGVMLAPYESKVFAVSP